MTKLFPTSILPGRRLLAAILALTVWVSASASQSDRIELPDLGDPAESALSVSMERDIGRHIMREIRDQRVILDDLVSHEYINSLGHRLLAEADAALHDFNFFIIKESGINAFALPGGYIGINAGLILATKDESELAAVVAHEIAHVTQRHLARAYFHQQNLQGPVIAAMIAAILIGGEAGKAAMAAASAGSVQSQINFTRKNEQEADRVGISMLARAGFRAESMATLFEKMHREAKLYGGAPPEFLSTHPVHGSRIAEARDRAARYPRLPVSSSELFRITRARLRVLMIDNPARLANDIKRSMTEGRNSDGLMNRYSLAYAQLKSGQIAEAAIQAEYLLEQQPDQVDFNLLQAEIDMALGEDEKVLARLERVRYQHPDHHVLTLEYSRLLIQIGQADKARKILEDYLVFRSGNPAVYRLLSHASRSVGAVADSHEFMAMHHHLNGDLEQAIQHLEAALRTPLADYYQQARMQALLKRLQQEQQRVEAREKAF